MVQRPKNVFCRNYQFAFCQKLAHGTGHMDGLIADIGGTNARFALVDTQGRYHHAQVLSCDDFPKIHDAANHYLDTINRPNTLKKGSFCVAGPVTGDHFQLTNHPWNFSVMDLAKSLNLNTLHLINDFEAVALGIQHTSPEHLYTIGPKLPRNQKANIGVIGPGTGLGVGMMIYDDINDCFVPAPGEGGHVTMPARTMREFELFHWLETNKYSHVSAERVCSGKGLVNVYNALRDIDGLKTQLPDRDPSDISQAAINGECYLCKETLDMMIAFLGRVAGNLALTMTARGGIYLAGGILPKIGIEIVEASTFRTEFESKGRFTGFMKEIPTYVVTDPFLALKGLCADLARQQI